MQLFVQNIVDSRWFKGGVLALILINAVILGADTFRSLDADVQSALFLVDRLIIAAFVLEVALRIYAEGLSYFRRGWNIFDFVIVGVSLVAATSGLGALRAFRVLRVLRVITVIPRMRVVVSALLDAIPGIASVGVVLALIVYVFAVIAANLYGDDHAALFGNVLRAMYTLFQVMTLEGWPDIAGQVRETHPRSWIFFLSFVLIATFTMLNLFVAIVVRVVEEESDPLIEGVTEKQDEIAAEIANLRKDIAQIADRLPPR